MTRAPLFALALPFAVGHAGVATIPNPPALAGG